jgi:glycerol-3-phosphate acyltransferase PlsY
MATTFGAFVGLAWLPTLIAAAVWLVLAVAFRYASVASMAAVVTIPVTMAVVPDPFAAGRRSWCRAELIVCGVAVAALVLVRHKGNIVRLLHGTEHKGTRAAQ